MCKSQIVGVVIAYDYYLLKFLYYHVCIVIVCL
jgi:hypothetical protein